MNRSLIALAALVLPAVATAQAQVTDLKGDTRLDKPVTAELKMVSLKSALSQLSKQLGFTVEPAPLLQDLKVNIFVTETSARKVLTSIAEVLQCEWKKDGDMLRLSQSDDIVKLRKAFLLKEDLQMRKGAEAQTVALMKQAAAAQATMENPKQGRGPLPGGVYMSPSQYSIAQTFRQWGNAEWKEFWAGNIASAVVTTNFRRPRPGRGSGTNTPPTDATTAQVRPGAPAPNVINYALAKYNQLNGQLEFSFSQNGSFVASKAPLIANPIPVGPLATDPYAKTVLAWPSEEEASADSLLDLNLTQGDASPVPSIGDKPSVGDCLELIHQRSGVPIVSDAFRMPAHSRLNLAGQTTARAAIKQVAESEHGFLKITGGIVQFRSGGFWRLREHEIPEVIYKTYEAKKDGLSLEDYSNFACALTQPQILAFQASEVPLTKFDSKPIQEAVHALRFYGNLNSHFKTVATHGDYVPYSQLDRRVQGLFYTAFMQGMTGTGKVLGKGLAADPGSMGFTLLEGGNVQSLMFGVGRVDGVMYDLTLTGNTR